ncbi:MAG: glycosyltransferase [Candidatus Woesearchaeota archaeon]
MKIDVVGPTFPIKGGISHYNTLMCKALAKKHDVNCYSFKRLYWKPLYPGVSETEEKSKEKIDVEAERLVDSVNPYSWLKTYKKIKKDKADLLIMPWWTSWLSPVFFSIAYMTKKFTSTKILFLCHNVMPHQKEAMMKPFSKLAFTCGDYFITHSKQEMDELLSMKKDANVKVGVHPTYDVFNQKEWNKEDVRKELNLKDNVILFFGYVKPYKGLMSVIESLPEVLKKHDVTLLIVGEFWKPTKQEVLDKAKELNISDNIRIVDGYVPNEEVGKYYSVTDVVALPYTSPVNSGIVQTSFAFNVPVIVSDIGGLPDVVIEGKTGFVIPMNDTNALSEAIIKFYDNKSRIDFVKNIQEDKKRFEWDRLTELIESFF